MVNTRAQASDPARDTANPDQDHAVDVLVNGATGEVPPPYFQQLVEGGQRKKKPAKRPGKTGNNLAPTSSHVPGQNRPMERSESTSTTESPERRNPRYSRAEDHHAVQEQASRTARSTGGSSRPVTEPARNKTELSDYLNSKRSANVARTDPRVDKIWNRVFQEEERTVDLDRSPFTAEILSRPLPTKFKMPSLDLYDGAVIQLTTWITSAPI
ncbi:hypothetical protein Nepgr_023329 [Nepenthes gracilis]|uniref:Uncharacterized protein n=1 Tax=Nepenthes gracilis TaxID=150966 RepID=A0AAD3T2C6_NEPGR|nr:hypothetical protein Nepgr_023329 [Nepenthes gracilis]